jgi:hypothetical protein
VVSQDLLTTLMQKRVLPPPSTVPLRALQNSEQSWQLKPVLIWKQAPLMHSCPAPQQAPLQRTAHAPPQQPSPAGQTVPQAPQLAGSVWRSAHIPSSASTPQQVCPAEQFGQLRVPPQPSLTVPHWPGLQLGCGVQQLPAKQIWPGSQVLSQMPQFSGSVWRSVHSSPQQVRPGSQHSPAAAQQDPASQHVAPQQMSPPGQHTEPQQVWVLGQHSAPQQLSPLEQHTEPQQTAPGAHGAPLGPQGGP